MMRGAPLDDPEVAGRLEGLEALTDASIAHLDVDALLVELLARVRAILDADTAAVLMLDADAGVLVARAAQGIEEEVRQGVQIPLGIGFAGSIAATKRPVRLNRVDATTVSNPILWEKGIRVMLGVPLLSDGTVIGVLHVGRLHEREFDERDSELLAVLAERIAGAIQIRALALERAATLMLERSLLPAKPPTCEGFEFAVRYVPAEGRTVGGDWYDLFILPSGQLWVVVGDVAGHGVHAAVVMGRIRSAFRAYALLDNSPGHVLDLVHRKVAQFEMGTFATIACGVTSPPYDVLTFALAGHPPPVVVPPNGAATVPDYVEVTPPVGVSSRHPRGSATLELEPGTVVAFYTDGLIERRGESLDAGFQRIRDAVTPGPPEAVAAHIMRTLVGSTVTADDIALVVMRRSPVVP